MHLVYFMLYHTRICWCDSGEPISFWYSNHLGTDLVLFYIAYKEVALWFPRLALPYPFHE